MSHISTSQFMQDPVDAVQITPENINQLALWVHGEVKVDRTTGRRYIEMEVSHPTGRRMAKAYPKDWIVTVRTVRRVYGNRAFTSTFKPVPERSKLLRQIEMYMAAAITDGMTALMAGDLSDDEKAERITDSIGRNAKRILDLL
ncbi:hypothetical protein SEA_SOSHI_72 [Streptomyces phage Soshi]|uniref:Uncharacterized protein n=1 Tax=Streptomyces phage Soshi TaxID=2601694 RepID=A0A5J6DB69_9CAUD|nr:hypothetical protein SEA_SOSHI_72 [Streptomyces phage Soshi]